MHNQNKEGVDLDKLQRFNNRSGLMNPESSGLYVRYVDVRELLARRAEPNVAAADERAMYSQDDVIELLRVAGIPDSNLRSLYAGHGLTLYLEHLTAFANTTRAALASPAVSQKDGAAVETKCKTCGGMGIVDDGEIDCYQSGEPFENGPVKCVKDSPDCTPAATTASASEADLQAMARSPHHDCRQTEANLRAENARLHEIIDSRAQAPSRDAAQIKTWADRMAEAERNGYALLPRETYMFGEIFDLRAALANSGASYAANAGEDSERDAKRYRWLRQADWDDITSLYWSPQVQHAGTPDACMLALDDAIDAAIAPSAEQEAK
jgi:hypothetical protein